MFCLNTLSVLKKQASAFCRFSSIHLNNLWEWVDCWNVAVVCFDEERPQNASVLIALFDQMVLYLSTHAEFSYPFSNSD